MSTLSESNRGHIRNFLHKANEYFRANFNKGLLEVTSGEVLQYFKNHIDPMDLKKTSKRKYRHNLASYYNWVQAYKKDIENVDFKIPIPSSKIFDFTGTMHSLEELKKGSQQLLTMDILKKVLKQLYFTRPPRIFVALCLIAFSGARVSEVLHVELENLDVKERWFFTIVKSPAKDKREGVYFFPVFFIPTLEKHIKMLRLEYDNPKYLFQSGDLYLTSKTIEEHIREVKEALGLKAKVNPHAYRGFLNVERFERGMQKDLRKFLLNQTENDVNIGSYMKKYEELVELRAIYDQYNPFTIDILPNPQL